MRKAIKWLLIILSVLLAFLCAGFMIAFGRKFGLQETQVWISDNHFESVLLVMTLYAVKSLSVFFPLTALYCMAGLLVPLPAALALNTAGLAVCASVPYWVGRMSSFDFTEKLRKKYPKFAMIETLQQKGSFPFAALMRVVGILPGDLVSLYFGAVKLPYRTYLWGSLLGLAPAMVVETILGKNITTPLSPPFLIALFMRLLIALLCLISCRRIIKSK